MNLIVTCPRRLEDDAASELAGFLADLGDADAGIVTAGMPGILVADTSLDPVAAVAGVRERLADEPWSVRYCLRLIPVQEETGADPGGIADAAARLAGRMGPGDSYRITVEKRNSEMSGRGLITEIAARIPNRVSLEHPDWTVLVEILGRRAGVSVLGPGGVLSVERTRHGDS